MKGFKKSIAWILMFVLVFAMSAFSASAASEEYMKIGLRYGSSETAAQLTSDSGFALAEAGDNAIRQTGTVYDDTDTLTLELTGGKIQVKDSAGKVLTTLKGDGTECIVGGEYFSSSEDKLKFNGKNYRGGIMPYINASGQMNIINYLSTDDYARGVVHSEIGQSSHIEAIKAQAVAIRSFAVTNKGKHSSQGFDICTTVHCQVYTGADSEYESTNRAVDETKGEMVYYQGKPVSAFYFANSGGHTENSEDAWVASLGYLRGKADPYSPDYSWTVKLTRADLTEQFASEGLGTVESITIDSVNDSGYAASVTVQGSRKSITYEKEAIRSALGVSLKSRNFTFETEGGTLSGGNSSDQTEGDVSSGQKVYGLSAAGVSELNSQVSVMSAGGTEKKSLNGLTALGSAGSKTIVAEGSGGMASGGRTVTFDDDSDVLIINVKGYGHGVGMSQQGAQQMAKQGFTYKEILEFYYTGIEVK